MPRGNVSAYTIAETDKTSTSPFHLIQIDFELIRYYSTRGDMDWNGISWLGVPVQVNGPFLSGGVWEGDLRFIYTPEAFSLFVGNDTIDVPCKIWVFAGPGPYAVGDGNLVFEGVLDGVSGPEGEIIVGFTDQGSRVQFAPYIFCEEMMKHLPNPGREIAWNNTIIKVEARR